MIKLKNWLLAGFLVVALFAVTNAAFADIKILGETIKCDPALPPNDGGCGFFQFVAALKAGFDFMLKIALPIAGVFIIWGGVVIMTAGGSEARVSQGKAILKYAIVGLVLALGAWLIVYTLYILLPLSPDGQDIGEVLFPDKSLEP